MKTWVIRNLPPLPPDLLLGLRQDRENQRTLLYKPEAVLQVQQEAFDLGASALVTISDSDLDQLGYTSQGNDLKEVLDLLDEVRKAETNGCALAAVAGYRKIQRIAGARSALLHLNGRPK